jgi:hypothetical protein
LATCNFPSGTARNHTTPQIYTVTAQDGSPQTYTVRVQKIASASSGSYQQKVLASGPVSYWPLNEASGTTAFDIAIGLNNITYGGTLTLNQLGLRTDGNRSMQFTTAADPGNTRAPYGNSLNPREFTVECWVKSTDAVAQYLTSWKRYPPLTNSATRQYFLIFLGDKLKIIFYREIYCWLAKCTVL